MHRNTEFRLQSVVAIKLCEK